jgi:hypothetical protein
MRVAQVRSENSVVLLCRNTAPSAPGLRELRRAPRRRAPRRRAGLRPRPAQQHGDALVPALQLRAVGGSPGLLIGQACAGLARRLAAAGSARNPVRIALAANADAVPRRSLDLSLWQPLIEDRAFVPWLVRQPGAAEVARARHLTLAQAGQLEDAWRANPAASLADLAPPGAQDAPAPVALRCGASPARRLPGRAAAPPPPGAPRRCSRLALHRGDRRRWGRRRGRAPTAGAEAGARAAGAQVRGRVRVPERVWAARGAGGRARPRHEGGAGAGSGKCRGGSVPRFSSCLIKDHLARLSACLGAQRPLCSGVRGRASGQRAQPRPRRRRERRARPARRSGGARRAAQARHNVTVAWDTALNQRRVARFVFPRDDSALRLVLGARRARRAPRPPRPCLRMGLSARMRVCLSLKC